MKQAILMMCCMVMTIWTMADAVSPRNRYRGRDYEAERRMAMEKARMESLSAARLGPGNRNRGVPSRHEDFPASVMSKKRTPRFRVTEQSCCKIGEKASRKRMSCNPSIHTVQRRLNSVHKAKLELQEPVSQAKMYKKLSLRISKCSLMYAKNFEKCCQYHASYKKELDMCKRLKGASRRSCKLRVKKKYV